MKSIYEALNSKLAKAIVCSILGLYIIYLIVLTVLFKSPFEFPIVFQSVLYTNFGLVGFWDDPASPCQPTAFGVEQIFIISLILLFTLINLLTDKFDDHEIIRFSLLFGAFALLLSNFIVYVQNDFGFERFTHFTWFFPVMIINGALMLFTIFKMVLCFANRKMIFHRYFIEYGCFILGIYFTSFMLSFAQTIYNPVEFPWSYIFAYGFRQMGTMIFSKKPNEIKDFPGYKERKNELRKKRSNYYLAFIAIGLLFLLATIIIYIITKP